MLFRFECTCAVSRLFADPGRKPVHDAPLTLLGRLHWVVASAVIGLYPNPSIAPSRTLLPGISDHCILRFNAYCGVCLE